jgi:hemolysin activation/secretion protein
MRSPNSLFPFRSSGRAGAQNTCSFLLAAAFLAVVPVRAQAPRPGSAADTAERVQREENDRQREEFRRARERARPPTVLEVPLPSVRPATDSGVKREIRQLDISGADHLRPKFRAQLIARFTGQLGVDDVESLLSEITRYYILRGYATARAYLPEQDLNSGVLHVIVVEGRIERLQGPGLTPNIFPVQPGDLLNLRDLEQGIDNLNRLGSNHATLDLQPGSAAGGTVVAIHNEPTSRWHFSESFDNTGSRDTGRNQGSATILVDNPLGLADSLSVNHRRAIPYHAGVQASESTTASYSVPWDWQLFTLGASQSSYALQYHAPSGFLLPFTGDSRSVFLRFDRGLFRNQDSRLNASATLTWHSSKNYLLGSLIGVSSRDTSTLDLGIDYSTAWGKGVFTASAGIGLGLPLFGSLKDPAGLPDYAPRTEFLKFVYGAGYSRSFVVASQNLSFSTSLTGQYTRDVLYGSDQLTVGGPYAVRGFDRTNLAGDIGYVWRNDLSETFVRPAPFGGRFGQQLILRPALGVDQGRGWSRVDLPGYSPQEGALFGASVALTATLGRGSVELAYRRSLDRPRDMPGEDGTVYFRAAVNF